MTLSSEIAVPDPVAPLELSRMFFGDQGLMFYAEIIVRTLIIYVYTFLLLRLFGRRTKASMSIMDVIVIVALGSAVGDVAFYPEVPILHCLLVVTLIVGFNKLLVIMSQKSHRLRDVIEGDATIIIKDGVILMDRLAETSVGRQALLEMLRAKGICNLSQVGLGVLEPSCEVSIFLSGENACGLSILPPDPAESDNKNISDEIEKCCAVCGLRREHFTATCCSKACGSTKLADFQQPKFAN